VLQEDLIGIYN